MTKRVDSAVTDEAPTPTIEFPLSKPIVAYGQEMSVLKMRKPTGEDVLQVGNPVRWSPFADPPLVEHDYGKVIAMVARLANVPSLSLKALDPEELASLAWAISPFFIPRRLTTSSEHASN